MAHVVVEYTNNLTPQGDIPALLAMIAKDLRNANGVFPIGGIRVRAIRLDDYVIADGAADDAFVHITVKMAAGRPEEFKKTFFTAMFENVKAHFAALYEKRYLALSMYVEESDETGSFKHNNIHMRFKKGSS